VTQQLIESHLVSGEMRPGGEIALSVDQTLTQDATGTLVMLELEALGLDRVRTEVSVQYVDHNLLQADSKNPDDHLFLRSACRRFGLWFSKPGNGVSHPVHMQRFGAPGKSMIGSDSHTCAAGSLGMLAIGVGGLDVAMTMAGEPLYLRMPEIWGVELTGELPPWVSAKNVVLEMLRKGPVARGRHDLVGEGSRPAASPTVGVGQRRDRAGLWRGELKLYGSALRPAAGPPCRPGWAWPAALGRRSGRPGDWRGRAARRGRRDRRRGLVRGAGGLACAMKERRQRFPAAWRRARLGRPSPGGCDAMSISGTGHSGVDLDEAARQLAQAAHDAPVAYDSISLGDLDWAHTNAVTARAEADAAENVLRAALWAGAGIAEDR